MFIIWGSCKRKKVTKYTIPDMCGCCGTGAHMNIIKIYNYGHIFYIPIFTFNTKYYVECPKCGAARQMTKAEFKQIKLAYKNGQMSVKQATPITQQQVQPMQVQNPVEMPQPQQTMGVVAQPQSVEKPVEVEQIQPQDSRQAIVEKLIWQDIDKVMANLVSKDLVQDNEKFNMFIGSLKMSLFKKYGDANVINKVITDYFEI